MLLWSTGIRLRDCTPWFDRTSQQMKRDQRKLERKWLKTKDPIDYDNFQIAKIIFRDYVNQQRSDYINNKIAECGRDTKKLYKEVFLLLDIKKDNPLPSGKTDTVQVEEFASFFINKVENIRQQVRQTAPYHPENAVTCKLNEFKPMLQL